MTEDKIRIVRIDREYVPPVFKRQKKKASRYSPTWWRNSSMRKRNLKKK